MKIFPKPNIWKIIVAAIITILSVHTLKYCPSIFDMFYGLEFFNACDISILVKLISIPTFLLYILDFNLRDTPLFDVPLFAPILYLLSFLYVYYIIHILSWKLIDKYRKENGTLNLYEACRTEVAEWRCINFPMGVIIGSILLIILMNVIPIFAPIIAGIIAGISACKSRHSDSAGFVAGTLGGMVYLISFINNSPIPIIQYPYFGLFESIVTRISIIFEASFLYFGILSLIGGILGGVLYNHMPGIKAFLVNRNY